MTYRLLLVEDSHLQAELLRSDLEGAGYEVVLAGDGAEALERLAEHVPDAVISDVMMPRMTGYELCGRIKADPRLADVPVLLLTSLSDPVDIVRGLEAGADNFLTKPYRLDRLLQRVDTVLQGHRSGARDPGEPTEVSLFGHRFRIDADRQQVLELLMSSFEDLVRTNERLREREQELAARKAQLRHTLEAAGVATWKVWLPEGRCEWSENTRALFGLDAGRDIGRLDQWLARVHEEDRERLTALAESLVASDQPELPDEWEYRIRGDDGGVRSFSGRGQLTRHADGLVVTGVAIDITHRRELEDELRVREEMMSGIIAASPDAILVTDADGRIAFASDRVRDIIGIDAEEMLGRPPRDFLATPDQEAVYRVPGQVRLRGGDATDRLRVEARHADGRLVTVDARIGELRDDDGDIEGYVAVLRDVTEQARLEAELERARDEADEANRAKSEYLSRMSHELRTPMNTVLGFSQLLQLSDLAPEDRDAVDRILRAGRHLLALIDDVLDIARIEAGNMPISVEPVGLGQIVRTAGEFVQRQAAERDISLHLPDDGDDLAHVLADRQRIAQVVINLLSNAVKYNRPGGEIRVACEAVEGGWCRLAVADTGYGIAPEDLHRVFTPFDRLGADLTEVTGSGLGLALSASLVEAMGGRIGLESVPGEGSTFWVELREAASPAEPELEETTRGRHDAIVPAGTVVYVEDNPLNFELVRRALASAPELELLHAATGEEGLELVERRLPDLVLLDLHLSGLSGREVLAELRERERTRRIPIVVLSADATTTSTDELLDAGADGYLTKPLELAELRQVVSDVLHDSRGSQPSSMSRRSDV